MVLDKFGATQLHKPFQKENLNSKQVITGSAHNIKAERNRKDTEDFKIQKGLLWIENDWINKTHGKKLFAMQPILPLYTLVLTNTKWISFALQNTFNNT